jgi:hypothetical protein
LLRASNEPGSKVAMLQFTGRQLEQERRREV